MRKHYRPVRVQARSARAPARPRKRGIVHRTLSFAEETAIFLAAFAAVVLIQLYVIPEVGANNNYFLLNGDYVAVGATLAFTFGLGAILRYLLVLTFHLQFNRRKRR